MNSNDSWILDAMYLDESKVRNKTCFDIWRSLNDSQMKHRNIEGHFVELFINHQSIGLYCFAEKFTSTKLNTTTESVFYKGSDNKPNTQFEVLPKGNPNKGHWGDWLQEIPDAKQKITWDSFEELLELAVKKEDIVFMNQIHKELDLDIAIDYYLFINLINGYDNMGKNWMFYQEKKTDLYTIVPWDLDATWGRAHDANKVDYTWTISNHLFDRLITLNPQNFKQRLKQRWTILRSQKFSAAVLIATFKSNFDVIRVSNVEEVERRCWNSSLDLDKEEAYITQWLQNRLSFVDNHIQNL
jgi:hypothetical protein